MGFAVLLCLVYPGCLVCLVLKYTIVCCFSFCCVMSVYRNYEKLSVSKGIRAYLSPLAPNCPQKSYSTSYSTNSPGTRASNANTVPGRNAAMGSSGGWGIGEGIWGGWQAGDHVVRLSWAHRARARCDVDAGQILFVLSPIVKHTVSKR